MGRRLCHTHDLATAFKRASGLPQRKVLFINEAHRELDMMNQRLVARLREIQELAAYDYSNVGLAIGSSGYWERGRPRPP